jgi:RNA polymerase sigma-70 factor (ECF subfamily)
VALRAFKGFAEFRGKSSPQWHAWLKKVFLNHFAQALRDAKRQKRDALELISLDAPGPTEPREVRAQERSPSQSASRREEWRLLLANLTRLPDAQREAIRLCYLEELPVAQAAAQMNRTQTSVRSLLQRGLSTLRNRMAGESGKPGSDEAARALVELLERRDRGESPDPEAFAAEHPGCADELRVMFHWIDQLRATRPPKGS